MADRFDIRLDERDVGRLERKLRDFAAALKLRRELQEAGGVAIEKMQAGITAGVDTSGKPFAPLSPMYAALKPLIGGAGKPVLRLGSGFVTGRNFRIAATDQEAELSYTGPAHGVYQHEGTQPYNIPKSGRGLLRIPVAAGGAAGFIFRFTQVHHPGLTARPWFGVRASDRRAVLAPVVDRIMEEVRKWGR